MYGGGWGWGGSLNTPVWRQCCSVVGRSQSQWRTDGRLCFLKLSVKLCWSLPWRYGFWSFWHFKNSLLAEKGILLG